MAKEHYGAIGYSRLHECIRQVFESCSHKCETVSFASVQELQLQVASVPEFQSQVCNRALVCVCHLRLLVCNRCNASVGQVRTTDAFASV